MQAAQQSQQEVDRTLAANGSSETLSNREIARLFPELEVLDFIGRGGMGAVYKVRQKNLDRVVALKVFLDRRGDPEFEARFQREARALARLNHPNIVTVHEFGARENVRFLVMEFIDGVNLRQLTLEERLSPEMALQMVPQLCDALQYAHDCGVIHRDIKPENLLLDTRGKIKVADFGLAKMTGNEFNGTLTRSQQVMGTFNYMAPEQRERPTEVDHRADIYSLGVVIYELLTGELPIGRFQPPSSKSAVNNQLDEVVMRALEKEPERRYQRASEFKTSYESVSSFKPMRSAVPPVKSQNQPQPEPPRGTRCIFTMMAGQEKRGNWIPGDPQVAITIMGGTHVDLTQVQASEVNLTLFTLMGGVDVTVPHGAQVDLDGFILMGSSSTTKVNRSLEVPCTMKVRIRSWGAMGGCEVRTPKTLPANLVAAKRKGNLRLPPTGQFTFRNAIMFLYSCIAWLVTFSVPAIFLAKSFSPLRDMMHENEAVTVGILTAIFAGFLWCWSDYIRIMIGAGPKEQDAESLHEYHTKTKLGTVIRSFGLLAAFACGMLFVIAARTNGNEDAFRLAGVLTGMGAVAIFIAADRFEELFYGKLNEDSDWKA